MAVAVLCGIFAGLLSFLPLLGGVYLVRRVSVNAQPGGKNSLAALALLSVVFAGVILFACAYVCLTIARDVAIAFVVAQLVAFLGAALMLAIAKMLVNRG